MAKITVTVEDQEDGGCAVRMDSDLPLAVEFGDLTLAQQLAVRLVDMLAGGLHTVEKVAAIYNAAEPLVGAGSN